MSRRLRVEQGPSVSLYVYELVNTEPKAERALMRGDVEKHGHRRYKLALLSPKKRKRAASSMADAAADAERYEDM